MSFQQGLSGLSAASKSLDAIGNNVANSNTVGFKASQAQFADVYASSLTGAGTGQVGIGVQVAAVAQQFTQGNITGSNNPLDVAINGGGFFRMSDNGTINYARNGQFQLDQNGFIVSSSGARLTGYVANNVGVLSTGAPADLNINTADLPPNESSEVNVLLNLDSRKPAIDQTVDPFDINDPATYHNATSVSVFDSLGNSHVMQTFFVKTSPLPADPPGTLATWQVYGAVDGALLPAPAGGNIGSLTFASDGSIDTAATTLPLANIQLPVSTGATTPIGGGAGISVDFTGTTQFGSAFSVNTLNQDGYASGRLSGFNIGDDGIITGRYTNGKSATLGQVVLANFTNPNGLQPLGNNVWASTSTSGPELVGGPGSGSLGSLQSSAVEDSNVDLTAELVNMITAQRFYQANAQTIKTQDQVMQTLVNLR
ncbi:flagellar hook protein FlgE [Janthinobacterium sp. 17J80-10]|uniref:flagellar hook protein FlgE n=1 Tax=Janthinobacterium sp. 17J80-10 TaxID=2497863 RepID=UPI001005A023|nr:flagellar hook protein FlgE [Janthinobacterium sp. 17J80-10]QAU34345.1 flagellar hook protein FlgE [Janthinobacterium sp. 17J80-10]